MNNKQSLLGPSVRSATALDAFPRRHAFPDLESSSTIVTSWSTRTRDDAKIQVVPSPFLTRVNVQVAISDAILLPPYDSGVILVLI